MTVFHDFYATRNFEKSINATFLALILKNLGHRSARIFALSVLSQGFTKLLRKC
jgi:hypothetical protein